MKQIKNLFLTLFILISAVLSAQQDTLKLNREARSLLREGNALYNKQKFTDASVAYKKALGKNANYNKAAYNLGNALYQEKNYQEAVPQFELIVKTAKDKFSKAEAYHNIGNAMMEQKQYQQAVDAYKNALRNNPNDDETRYNLAVAQKMVKKQGGGGNNKDKNKNKNDKNKEKKNQDKNKNKENDKKDKDKEENNKDQQNKNQDKNKKDNQDKKEAKQQPKPQQGKMSPEQVKQLLESLNNEEKKTQKKMNVKKAKGPKIKQEKDW